MELFRETETGPVMRSVQDWARVTVVCGKDLYSHDALRACKSWIVENATGDYEIFEFNHYARDFDGLNVINKLVFRFEDPSDALLFKLSDPVSGADPADLIF